MTGVPTKLKYNDESHIYTLAVDGGKAVRTKSVTTLAKIPDDSFNLVRWKTRQIAIGLAKSPHLIESVAAHHTDRDKLDDLCEQALTASGADAAAEWGTAVHRMTERIDGNLVMIETPLMLKVVDTWNALLHEAGLELVPELMERVVVYGEPRICGKFDRIVRNKATGKLHVADLKTGASAIRYPHSVATQLALYANAPYLAQSWEGLSGETTVFEPMPAELDKEVGYVIYMPAHQDEPHEMNGVYAIDLALGWRAVKEIIWPTLKWRAVKPDRLLQQVVALP